MNRLREILINGIVVIILAIITVIMLELPKKYFNGADERLLKNVTVDEYSVSIVNEEMNLYQKIAALKDSKTIVAEGKTKFFTDEEKEEMTKSLLIEICDMLDCTWEKQLLDTIPISGTIKQWRRLRIIQVIDNEIYSFDLGLMAYHAQYSDNTYGIVLFDLDTGKILYINAFSDNLEYISDYYKDGIGIYEQEYDDSENKEAYSDEAFVSVLEKYYGFDIPREFNYSHSSNYELYASPFTADDIDHSATMSYILDYVYKEFDILY